MPAFPDQPTADISAALTRVPTGTAVSVVAKRLIDLFMTGDIPAGTRLPPEREIAQQLGIGRSAVREALAALEILGLIEVRPGSGSYLQGTTSELLPETLSWGLILGGPKTKELIQLRGGLEVFAAELAAEIITDESLIRLQRHVSTMAESYDNRTRFIEADLKFHLEVAASSGNTVLADLLRSIRSLLRIWVERGVNDAHDFDKALAEHKSVFEALRNRNPAEARQAMSLHMVSAAERLSRPENSAIRDHAVARTLPNG